MDDVRRFDAVQDHVHDRDDVGQRLLLLAEERTLLERLEIRGRQLLLRFEVIKRLAQEAGRTAGPVVNPLADLRLDDLHHGANQRARRVILAPVAAGVAHVLDLGFVQVR